MAFSSDKEAYLPAYSRLSHCRGLEIILFCHLKWVWVTGFISKGGCTYIPQITMMWYDITIWHDGLSLEDAGLCFFYLNLGGPVNTVEVTCEFWNQVGKYQKPSVWFFLLRCLCFNSIAVRMSQLARAERPRGEGCVENGHPQTKASINCQTCEEERLQLTLVPHLWTIPVDPRGSRAELMLPTLGQIAVVIKINATIY